MSKVKCSYKLNRITGFTLIELVIVIIIIAVLAVGVFTRFDGTSGYAEYTYQARLISSLRHMQQRAMQDTRQDYCFRVAFDLGTTPAFGLPSMSYISGSASDTCSSSIDYSTADYLHTSETEMQQAAVKLEVEGDDGTPYDFIGFNHLGQPLSTGNNCNPTCKIALKAEQTLYVCVEPQGYVHACD